MQKQGTDWGSSTVIEEDEIGEFVYQVDEEADHPISVDAYSLTIKPIGYNVDGLCDYLGRRFADLVFPRMKLMI